MYRYLLIHKDDYMATLQIEEGDNKRNKKKCG